MSTKRIATFLTDRTMVLIFSALIVITILGLLIRTSGIQLHNILFLFDPARDLLYVKKIVIDHHPLLIGPSSGGLQGYFHGVLWYYLLSIPFFLGRGNPAGITLFVALISTASIVYTFSLLKKITSPLTALLGATIYAFAFFSTQTAIFPWNPYPIIWLMPFFTLTLYRFAQRKKYALFLTAFLVGLMVHFEVIYGLTLLPTFGVMLIIETLRIKKVKPALLTWLIAVVLFLTPFLPSLVFDLRHDFLISRSLLTTLQTGGSNITHDEKDKTTFSKRLSPRLHDLYKYSVGSVSPQPFVNLSVFILVLVSIGIGIKHKEKHLYTFIGLTLLSLLVPFFFFLTLKYSVWSYYWIGSAPLYALTAVILIWEGIKKTTHASTFLVILFFLLLVTYNPLSKVTSWQKGNFDPGNGILANQLSVVDTIYQDANNEPFSVYVLTPPVYDYVYRYLFWWQGSKLHKQLPLDSKQKTVYVIVEKGNEIQDSSYFLKNVVRTSNKPIKKFYFPGGPKVEKIVTSPEEAPFDKNFLPQL